MVLGKFLISDIFFLILFWICLNGSSSFPAGHSDLSTNQPYEIKATTKTAKDSSQLNQQVMPIPLLDSKNSHGSSEFKTQILKFRGNDLSVFEPVTYKVKNANLWKNQPKPYKAKSVNMGKIHLRQNDDDDDDDDDDGGEYEGASDDSNCKSGQKGNKKSMPLMIIRGFDVMAMDMPLCGGKKCKKPPTEQPPEETPEEPTEEVTEEDYTEEDTPMACQTTACALKTTACGPPTVKNLMCLSKKNFIDVNSNFILNNKVEENKGEWGDWSSCSRSCGLGMQTRNRLYSTGHPERDTQFRPCHLGDCEEPRREEPKHEGPQMAQTQEAYRESLKT